MFCNAAQTRSGVAGISKCRTPIASQTALITQTIEPTVPASPTPLAPTGLTAVRTSRARNRIRHAIRAAEMERSRELGREILERELRRGGFSLPRLLEGGELEAVARAGLLVSDDDVKPNLSCPAL